MRLLAAIRSAFAVIVVLLVPVVQARAVGDNVVVGASVDSFHALRHIEQAGVALVPLTDSELAGPADPRTPRQAPLARGRPVAEEPTARPVVDLERADIAEASTLENAPSISAARRRDFPDPSEGPRPVDDPGARGRRAQESGGKLERRGEVAPPATRGRPAVEEEPDPRAVIDWLLNEYRLRAR
jgi:hypothetical protein